MWKTNYPFPKHIWTSSIEFIRDNLKTLHYKDGLSRTEAYSSNLRMRGDLQLTRLYPTLKSARPGQNTVELLEDRITFLWVSLLMLMTTLLLSSILR
jgi:hypothetical protein